MPLFRLPVEPSEANGIDAPSRIMVDQITTVRRSRLRASVGRRDDDLVRVNRAIAVCSGLAGAVRGRG